MTMTSGFQVGDWVVGLHSSGETARPVLLIRPSRDPGVHFVHAGFLKPGQPPEWASVERPSNYTRLAKGDEIERGHRAQARFDRWPQRRKERTA